MRFFIRLSYKGTNYHGWQIQKTGISIEGEIEKNLSLLLKTSINIIGAGRTDARVHAREMFAHFDFYDSFDYVKIIKNLNSMLGNFIKIWEIFPVKKNIHARFDALSRTYKYQISLSKDPFSYEFSWQLYWQNLNINKMNKAALYLLNYQDFSSFCKSGSDSLSKDCQIYEAYWVVEENLLCFYIKANRFLRNMVRAIVGTLVEVGREKISVVNFKKIIEAKDRKKAGTSAPAEGLFLLKIDYKEDIYL